MADELIFDWGYANLGHINRHDVRRDEVEQVFANDPLDLSADVVEGEQRYSAVGHTFDLRC